jgi:tripartite-type tricarboxylate transporter receptor subunit TctC
MIAVSGCRARHGFCCAVALLVFVSVSHAAEPSSAAGNFPTKPVRVIVGNAPGGGTDAVARLVGQRLSERWPHSVIVDNRGGGVGVIAMDLAARANPDGHTLLLSNIQMTINMLLKRVSYDIRQAYVPVVELTSQPYVAAVNPSLPVNSIRDFIKYAKSRPGAVNFGSPGSGSPAHIGIELFSSMAGLDMTHIPYKGNGPAMIDLMGGQIQMLFGTIVSVAPQTRAGKIKALAVTSLRRNPALPDLPTIAESGIPGYELSNQYGFFAPAGTPAAAVTAINRACNEIIASGEFKTRLAAGGVDAAGPNTPAEYRAAISGEVSRLQKFFSKPGLKLDRFL